MLEQRIKEVSDKLQSLVGERNLLKTQLTTVTTDINSNVADLGITEKARKLLELFVKSTEHGIQEYVEPIVTEALEFVFSQHLKFHIMFFNRRNQVEIDFVVARNEKMEEDYQRLIKDPVNNADEIVILVKDATNINYMYGGAINQVLSLILRLVIVEMLKVKGPVFFDEPTSMVSEEYSTRLGHLLLSLSKKFNRQYILITHSNSLASYASKIYQVTQTNKVSTVMLQEDGNA